MQEEESKKLAMAQSQEQAEMDQFNEDMANQLAAASDMTNFSLM